MYHGNPKLISQLEDHTGWKYFDRDKDPLLGQNFQQLQKRIRFSGARVTLFGRIRVWD